MLASAAEPATPNSKCERAEKAVRVLLALPTRQLARL